MFQTQNKGDVLLNQNRTRSGTVQRSQRFGSEPGLMTRGGERAGRHWCSGSGLRFWASPTTPRRSLLSAGPLNLAQPRNTADQKKRARWRATWTQTCVTNSNILTAKTSGGTDKMTHKSHRRQLGRPEKLKWFKNFPSIWLFWKWSELFCHFYVCVFNHRLL